MTETEIVRTDLPRGRRLLDVEELGVAQRLSTEPKLVEEPRERVPAVPPSHHEAVVAGGAGHVALGVIQLTVEVERSLATRARPAVVIPDEGEMVHGAVVHGWEDRARNEVSGDAVALHDEAQPPGLTHPHHPAVQGLAGPAERACASDGPVDTGRRLRNRDLQEALEGERARGRPMKRARRRLGPGGETAEVGRRQVDPRDRGIEEGAAVWIRDRRGEGRLRSQEARRCGEIEASDHVDHRTPRLVELPIRHGRPWRIDRDVGELDPEAGGRRQGAVVGELPDEARRGHEARVEERAGSVLRLLDHHAAVTQERDPETGDGDAIDGHQTAAVVRGLRDRDAAGVVTRDPVELGGLNVELLAQPPIGAAPDDGDRDRRGAHDRRAVVLLNLRRVARTKVGGQRAVRRARDEHVEARVREVAEELTGTDDRRVIERRVRAVPDHRIVPIDDGRSSRHDGHDQSERDPAKGTRRKPGEAAPTARHG